MKAHQTIWGFSGLLWLWGLIALGLTLSGFLASAQEAPHCHGVVQRIVQLDGVVTCQLLCDGECPDGGRCWPRQSVNHHGGMWEWCGCGDQEPRRCHIVLYRPGEGEGGGQPKVFCAGACPNGQPRGQRQLTP